MKGSEAMDVEGKTSTLPLRVSDIQQGHCGPFHPAIFPCQYQCRKEPKCR